MPERERETKRERLSEDTLRVPPGRPKYVHALLSRWLGSLVTIANPLRLSLRLRALIVQFSISHLRLRLRLGKVNNGFLPRATRPTWRRINERFDLRIMRRRRRRSRYVRGENRVKVGGHMVTTRIDVD